MGRHKLVEVDVIDYEALTKDLRKALAIARQYKHEPLELVPLLRSLANLLLAEGQFTKARDYLHEIVQIAVSNKGKPGCPPVIESRWNLSQCHFKAGANENALHHIDKIWEQLKAQEKQNCQFGLQVLILGARAHGDLEHFETALEYLDLCDEICFVLNSSDHVETQHGLRARFLEELERIPEAIAVREELIGVLERKLGPRGILGHTDVLAALYRKTGDEAKALALEERARAAKAQATKKATTKR